MGRARRFGERGGGLAEEEALELFREASAEYALRVRQRRWIMRAPAGKRNWEKLWFLEGCLDELLDFMNVLGRMV